MKYVESITVSPSSKIIKLDTWYHKAEATVCPCDADKPTVCWYSDDECVATVNPTTGHIYGVSLGTARIYACACDGSGVQDYITVTVSRTVPVERITLNRSYISIEKDTSATLVASIFPEDATDKSLTWCSSNENVASVANGVVCGIKNGTATITATSSNGKSASCTVTVTGDILVTSIELTPFNKTLNVGYSFFPSVTVCPTNATKKSVAWSSANSNIASVNPNSGLVYAKAVGTTIIYATACDGSGVCGCCTVRVVPVYVQDITVCPETLTLDIGESSCLESTVYPVNATNKNISWTSGDCNIADVDANGCVTAKSAGTTYICANATDGSGVRGCCEVTVNVNNNGNTGDMCYYIVNKFSGDLVTVEGAIDNRANVICAQRRNSILQIWKIDNISNIGYIKTYIDNNYGFNAYRGTPGNYNCDVFGITGNETDAAVRFIPQGNNYYKIELANYTGYYLTLVSEENNVRWRNTNDGDKQLWKLDMVDWGQYEEEHVEYHLIPQIATNYALYANKSTPFERLSTDTPICLKEFNYMNRQRWLIKSHGNSMRLYNQYGDNFVLCKKGENSVYVSNNLANECDLTIIPYNSSNMVEIKITQSNLYLTASGTSVTWESYNSSNHNSQLWELRAFPSNCYSGCDTRKQLTETTVKTLKLSKEKFLFRYYKPITVRGVQVRTFEKGGTDVDHENRLLDTITALEQIGVNISGEITSEADINTYINPSTFVNYVDNLSTNEIDLHHEYAFLPKERDYLRKHQLKIVTGYQDEGTIIEFFDPRHAQIDAFCALVCAKRLEQPPNTVIFFCVDELFYTNSQLDTIGLYFEIVRKIVNYAGYKIGVYGGDRVCKKVKEKMVNQVNGLASPILTFIGQGEDAWDNYPNVVNDAEIRQGDYFCYNGVTFDRNVATKSDYGYWE